MSGMLSETTKIKRIVLREVAELALKGQLKESIDHLPKKFTQAGMTNYRCCEYKERAILTERIKLALGVGLKAFPEEERLSSIAEAALNGQVPAESNDGHRVTIIDAACDRCPIDRIIVTNACRNCVAHHCLNACPKKAIEIVANRAYINKERCVECGLCAKACRFGAILEVERPCSRACAMDAIGPGESTSSKIDYAKCVECGACISACPFGAIMERSGLLDVIRMIKAGRPVIALVAPSYVGQFGPTTGWRSIESALLKAGFTGVVPVALGADMVAEAEADELVERLAKGEKLLLNSCCPSFKNMVKLRFPQLAVQISHLPSPMLRIAELVKEQAEKDARLIFIGPCAAKRREAELEGEGLIDGVLTFEELAALLEAQGITPEKETPGEESLSDAHTLWGLGFAKAGGVGAAVKHAVHDGKKRLPGRRKEIHTISCAGLTECMEGLKALQKGELDADFFEGMGCEGGCLGGPGTLVEAKASARALARVGKNGEKGEGKK